MYNWYIGFYAKVMPKTAASIKPKMLTVSEAAPPVGAGAALPLADPVAAALPEAAADVPAGAEADPDPLGAVAVGTEKPVTLPLNGPGGADADAPTPTRPPSA